MLLLFSRKQARLLLYFLLFLALYIAWKVLFKRKTTFENPELPELIVQKGNEHYFKRNAQISSTVSERKPHEWQLSIVENSEVFGKLNVHIWAEICGEELQSLRDYVLFPQFPSRRFYAKTTLFSHGVGNKNFGERIFGYLHPKTTGIYSFRVHGWAIEVWISTDAEPHHSKLLVKNPSDDSSDINIKHVYFGMQMTAGGKYYMEILHKNGVKDNLRFHLVWKSPKSSQYSELSGGDISRIFNDGHLRQGEVDDNEPIEGIPSVHYKVPFPIIDDIEQYRANLHTLPLIRDAVLENVLPMCEYKPSYLVDYVVKYYKGVWETHYNSLYPIDRTNVTRDGWVCLGNDVLEERKALQIVEQFMNSLSKAKNEKYKLERILSVEENHDKILGDRYLLELELREVKSDQTQSSHEKLRLSTYVYKLKGSKSLCFPNGYQWKKHVTVNIVLTVGGRQGRWVQHFINNIADIYRQTKDKNLNVVIMDFHSKDIDIRASLEKSGLPRYILLHMKSKFHKTIGLQYAMNVVTDPDDIVFVCDLHLYLPVTIVDQIRKHCIQGKTLFNPLLVRLDCGYTANDPHGRWEHDGFGPIATFKSDWDRFGGMNVEKFKHSWGGEDWEMVDRILTAGYEIERLKIMNFFHFFHTKKGMWQESEQ